ncbi:MAG: TolC family protein [Verrucomicrobiota bacterium]
MKVMTLAEAQQRVLSSDQSIQNALLEIRKAKLEPWSAITKYTPRLTGGASYSSSSSNDRDTKSGNITYKQPLLDLTFFSAYRSGKLSVQSYELQKKALERETVAGLAQAYYEVLKQQKLNQLNRQSFELAEKQLELARERMRVGEITSLDESRARLDVENARKTIIEGESSLTLAKNRLRNILNLPDDHFAIEEPEPSTLESEALDDVLQRAYRQREDYLAGELAIEQEREKKNQIIAEYAPTVSGQLRQQWVDPASNDNDAPWDASISVEVPFFEGGQREIDLQNADYQIEQSRLDYETLKKTIQEEIRNAWVQAQTLRQTLATLSIASETADKNYREIQAKYEVGSATSLEAQTALRDLTQAKTDFTTAHYDYEASLWELKRASGDLLKKNSS